MKKSTFKREVYKVELEYELRKCKPEDILKRYYLKRIIFGPKKKISKRYETKQNLYTLWVEGLIEK